MNLQKESVPAMRPGVADAGSGARASLQKNTGFASDYRKPGFLNFPYSGYVAALAAGLLNIAIFPRLDWGWLAFVAFLPLFLIVPDRTPRQLFGYYWIAGFIFRLGNLYWIYHVIQHYSSLPPLIAGGIIGLLCIYLGFFWGLCGYVIGIWKNRF
ncbi:MAG: hypothetical protein C5B54_01950, partial [Acidobacteria bacterium]